MEENQFDWVDFYKEFAWKLLDYKNNRSELINKVIKIYKDIEISLPTLERDNNIIDIDPFTVFGLFNKGLRIDNRIKILSSIANTFEIQSHIPKTFDSIPILNNQNATFYFFEGQRQSDDIDILWEFFESALNYATSNTDENKNKFLTYFDKAINVKGVANSKLTMGIYWIAPDVFLNLDKRNTWYIYESGKIPSEVVKGLPEIKGRLSADVYIEVMEKVKAYVYSEDSQFENFKELSFEAWRYSEEVNEEIKANQLDGEDEKVKLSKAEFIKWFKPIIEALKTLGGTSTPKDVRSQIINDLKLSDDVVNEKRGGKHKVNKFQNEVDWAKTYLVCEDIISNEKRGIWELTDFGYSVNMTDEYASEINRKWSSSTKEMREKLKENHVDKNDEVMTNHLKKYDESKFLNEVYLSSDKYNQLKNLLDYKKNIILQGAPGVGKTFAAKRLAYSIMGVEDKDRVKFVQFHQSYSYEDFIMGFRPIENGFELKTGAFYEFCKKAESDRDNEYFFIIDEINRGNLSKIFGELFMLIEREHRGSYLSLVYSDEKFSVPDNLYIIGMMNTADRSLAMLDYALRRRFAFFEFEPAFKSEGFETRKQNINDPKFDNLISCVERLNDVIAEDESLGKGFRIGHSYFCVEEEDYNHYETLNNIVEYELIPLINEYWFDDIAKVNEWSSNLRGAIKWFLFKIFTTC